MYSFGVFLFSFSHRKLNLPRIYVYMSHCYTVKMIVIPYLVCQILLSHSLSPLPLSPSSLPLLPPSPSSQALLHILVNGSPFDSASLHTGGIRVRSIRVWPVYTTCSSTTEQPCSGGSGKDSSTQCMGRPPSGIGHTHLWYRLLILVITVCSSVARGNLWPLYEERQAIIRGGGVW